MRRIVEKETIIRLHRVACGEAVINGIIASPQAAR